MASILQKFETRVAGWMGRTAPVGMSRAAIWLSLGFVLCWLGVHFIGGYGGVFGLLELLFGTVLFFVLLILAWRYARTRLLWSLRNKLALTYLLIGAAPVVLFVTLVGIAAYVAAGQFAIHLAASRMQAEIDHLAVMNANNASHLARMIDSGVLKNLAQTTVDLSELSDEDRVSRRYGKPHRQIAAFVDGRPLLLANNSGELRSPLTPPAWKDAPRRFAGMVLDEDHPYLVAYDERTTAGHTIGLLSSIPVDQTMMEGVSEGLGRAGVLPGLVGNVGNDSAGKPARVSVGKQSPTGGAVNATVDNKEITRAELRKTSIVGGTLPSKVNIADIRVRYPSAITMTDWETGAGRDIAIYVDSRPSLLYKQLYGVQVGRVYSDIIRILLISLGLFFGVIELVALMMALRLSRTITASVADIYEATQRVDQGELGHRISVKRADQLADLSKSFNSMTSSLQRLLEEQKEKERLQNELNIAQEVQANLFPSQNCSLERLELHGVCRPARSVSGDYYDFLVFHKDAVDGHPNRMETGAGIAIGDISGKGISAALLMATLHSAVRAYRFASEELIYATSQDEGLTSSRDITTSDCGELFESPGRILSLLNRHLYRSTQPEKYATLFLAHYDARSSRLTYSNAGQLPPLVLGLDGSVRRLDRGGTVVGLMDGMHYEEESFQMLVGDILIAYSDGVTEPENDFGEFGEERLVEVVRRYRHEPLAVISAQVMQALDAWIGAAEQPDDITLVLARQV